MLNSSRSIRLVFDQVIVLVNKDFKVKYNSTAIGFFWSLLVPLCMSFTYYFVFKIMMRWNTHNYLLYLLSGNFFWHFFSSVVMVNGMVMMRNASLLKKNAFRHELLLWGTLVAEGIHFLLTWIVLFAAMLYYHVDLQLLAGLINLAFLLLFFPLFVLGISYLYAALNIYFRDLERIMGILMQLWFFMSPVFIPICSVPAKYLWLYQLNPMAGFLGIFRNIFYEPGVHPETWLIPGTAAVLLFLLGRRYFNWMSLCFAEKM